MDGGHSICYTTVGIMNFDGHDELNSMSIVFRFDKLQAIKGTFWGMRGGYHYAYLDDDKFKPRLIDNLKSGTTMLVKVNMYRHLGNVFKFNLTGFTTAYNDYIKLTGGK